MANTKAKGAPIDEDEDLFHFDELYADKTDESREEVDLEEFLRAFADTAVAVPEVGKPALVALAAETPQAPVAGPVPAAVTSAPVVTGSFRLSRGAWIALVCLLCGQMAASLLVWLGGERARADVDRKSVAIEETAQTLRADFQRQLASVEELTRPIVSAEPSVAHDGLQRIERMLERGEGTLARRELYALLAIIDRLDASVREDTEARARFLIADSLRVEAERKEVWP